MFTRSINRRASATVVLLAASGLGLTGLSSVTAQAAGSATAIAPGATTAEPFSQDATGLPDVDKRGSIDPLPSQLAAVPAGAIVRWNRYGTPASLVKTDGYLSGPHGGTAVLAARTWLSGHADVFGMSAADIDDLRVVNDSQLTTSKAHAVVLGQQYGASTPALDGLVSVGVSPSGKIAYVSSSLMRTPGAPAAGDRISAVQAWNKAARDAGLLDGSVSAPVSHQFGWSVFTIDGFAQLQRARLRALALPGGGVRPVFETNVVNSAGGSAAAYTSLVDAITGKIWVRHNQVDNIVDGVIASEFSEPFQGAITATECGPDHTFTVDAATQTLVVGVSEGNFANDIVLNLLYGGNIVASSDTGTGTEVITYSIPAGESGDYTVRVCPFEDPTVPFTPPGDYVGVFTASEQAAPGPPYPYPPKWKYFVANPALDYGPGTIDNRHVGCWVDDGACDVPPSPLNNLAARAPWDQSQRTDTPTFTTIGNAANTAEAWLSPLTPGATHQQPVSPNRHYGFDNTPSQDFTDAWNNSGCDPLQLVPGGNDILASTTNLFAGHNRFHDFSYFLGFTEANYNLQDNNFGLTDPSRERDPEIGNVQAGAIDGGFPSYLGRDNANQIALQDGIPGITNQYLFQPIAGAFYSPCADGDFDAPVYGHEYTHAISNRMVAGPDAGLSGLQAGSMGESWSDQVALEYLFEHSYDIGADSPWVEGPYVTGNPVTGIRNYALDNNPLQYGDIGYDVTGAEVHADGEVWSAAMFDVRQQLVAKYNAQFPESDKALQLRCSDGDTTQQPPAPPLPPEQCPGGRRWIQLMFDSFLLQQSGTSMLDARDAYLAADKMRFGGADLPAIWRGFASDGMGSGASTTSTEDDQPIPSYISPFAAEGKLKVVALALDGGTQTPVPGKLYVGDYEARATPSADTDPNTPLKATVAMVPGRYHLVFQADGYGLFHFIYRVTAGTTSVRKIHLSANLASAHNGATIDGASSGLNTTKLIDDTEASNWAGTNPAGISVDTLNPLVNVDLAGGEQMVRSVRVSAMLRPADPAQDEDPNQPDDESGSRFTALRQFAIEVCTESGTSDCSSTLPAGAPLSPYTRIYTSPDDAFNGVRPRPLAPALLIQRFDVPDTMATHVRLVALENQCTGQQGYAGEQDNDPLNATDCKTASTRDESVRAAELEVFAFDTVTRPPGDPYVAMAMTGPASAAPGDEVTYDLTYTNFGPKPSERARITIASLPAGLRFLSGSGQVTWNRTDRSVVWRLGTVGIDGPHTVTLDTRVASDATLGTLLLTQAQFSGALTFSPPAAIGTLVSLT